MKNKNKLKTIYVLRKERLKNILSRKDVSSGTKLVLCNLIERSGYGKDYCWPSKRRIAEDIGLSSRQVGNHLNVLKKLRVLNWKRGGLNPASDNKFSSNKYNLGHFFIKVKRKIDSKKR